MYTNFEIFYPYSMTCKHILFKIVSCLLLPGDGGFVPLQVRTVEGSNNVCDIFSAPNRGICNS